MPRDRSEFKPRLADGDELRIAATTGVARPCVKMRALLLAVDTPPPRLERPKRLVVPLAKGKGTTGLRISAPPSSVQATIARSA